MRNPTYLFVIDSIGAGGAERSLVELLPDLLERGRRGVVVCLNRRDVGFEDEVRDVGFDVRFLASTGRLGRVREVRRIIREESPAIVYSSLFEASLVARLAAARMGIPVMVNLANTSYDPVRKADPNLTWWRFRLVQEVDGFLSRHLTDHFHAVSQAVKDSAVRSLRISEDRITVVRRGRDRARIGKRTTERRRAVRAALEVGDDIPVVVAVGRQEFQKGHRYLIEAFFELLDEYPEARLLIVGREGSATTALNQLVSELGLTERVRLLGHRADVTDVMAAADVFAFPSLFEGLGGALIEALALGLPVVATEIPAVREVVEPGVSADLVPAGDSHALADALRELLGDANRRSSYGENARDAFERRFRSEDATRRLLELLDAHAILGEG